MERGVGRWADDAAEVAAGLYLGDELGGGRAVDGVGYGVDDAGGCDGLVVVDIDGGGGAEGQGFLDLIFADAGDDVCADLERGEEGAAADASRALR